MENHFWCTTDRIADGVSFRHWKKYTNTFVEMREWEWVARIKDLSQLLRSVKRAIYLLHHLFSARIFMNSLSIMIIWYQPYSQWPYQNGKLPLYWRFRLFEMAAAATATPWWRSAHTHKSILGDESAKVIKINHHPPPPLSDAAAVCAAANVKTF